MFATTFVVLALSALPTNEALPPSGLNWLTDYSKAMTTAVAQQKPIAVFIGHGTAGYSKLVNDGQIPADADQILAKSFVCVYVDTDTEAGKTLAQNFAINNGLVISNKGGSHQALRHTGIVAPADLTQYLTQYGDVSTVKTTAERGVIGCANGQCPTVVPTGYQAPVQQYTLPAYYGNGYPAVRCTTSR